MSLGLELHLVAQLSVASGDKDILHMPYVFIHSKFKCAGFVLFVIVPFVLAAVISGALSSLIAVLNWQTLFTIVFIGLTIYFVIKIFD